MPSHSPPLPLLSLLRLLPLYLLFSSSSAAQVQQREVVVVGAGLTGSTAAFYLRRAGRDVLLAEAAPRVGGMVSSKSSGGFLWEEGPNSFKPTPEIVKLAMDLHVDQQILYADSNAPRYVYANGKRQRVPMGLWGAITTGVISTRGKLRAFAGLLGFVRKAPSGKEESVHDFVTRHLGSEVMETLMDPFLSGVYAGDPKRLSMQTTFPKIHRLDRGGGLLSGMFARKPKPRTVNPADNSSLPVIGKGLSLGSFQNGIETIPSAIKQVLGNDVAPNHELEAIRKIDDGFELQFRCSNKLGPVTMRCKQLVLATPAHVTGRLLQPIMPQARLLQQIYYPSISAVIVTYPKDAFREPLKGFGHLIPRSAGIRTLGTIYSSAIFPGRAPEGQEMLLSFIGGSQDPAAAMLSQEQLIEIADKDLRTILLKPDAPAAQPIAVKVFQRSIPQYEIGYNDLLSQVDAAVSTIPGLHIAGNFKSGVAVGDCIAAGMEMAAKVTHDIQRECPSSAQAAAT